MTLPTLSTIAPFTVEWMVDCLIEGTALAALASLALVGLRERTPRLRFRAWFAVLIGVFVLPLLAGTLRGLNPSNSRVAVPSPHAALLLPTSAAIAIFCSWAALAALGLARIALGLWH